MKNYETGSIHEMYIHYTGRFSFFIFSKTFFRILTISLSEKVADSPGEDAVNKIQM